MVPAAMSGQRRRALTRRELGRAGMLVVLRLGLGLSVRRGVLAIAFDATTSFVREVVVRGRRGPATAVRAARRRGLERGRAHLRGEARTRDVLGADLILFARLGARRGKAEERVALARGEVEEVPVLRVVLGEGRHQRCAVYADAWLSNIFCEFREA